MFNYFRVNFTVLNILYYFFHFLLILWLVSHLLVILPLSFSYCSTYSIAKLLLIFPSLLFLTVTITPHSLISFPQISIIPNTYLDSLINIQYNFPLLSYLWFSQSLHLFNETHHWKTIDLSQGCTHPKPSKSTYNTLESTPNCD